MLYKSHRWANSQCHQVQNISRMPPIPHHCYFFKKTKFFLIIPNFFFSFYWLKKNIQSSFLLPNPMEIFSKYMFLPWFFFSWRKYYRFLTFIFLHDDTHLDLAIQSLLSLHVICCRFADSILKLKDVTKVNEYTAANTHLPTYSEIFFLNVACMNIWKFFLWDLCENSMFSNVRISINGLIFKNSCFLNNGLLISLKRR